MTQIQKKFEDIQYSRPDLEAFTLTSNEIIETIRNASDPNTVINAIKAWQHHVCAYSTAASLALVHYTQNVADESVKIEKQFFDSATPQIDQLNLAYSQTLLASPFTTDINEAFGTLYMHLVHGTARTLSPEVREEVVEVLSLCNTYNECTASAKIEVDGSTYNLSSIARLVVSPDRDVRRKATLAIGNFLSVHRELIEQTFDKLVHLRSKIAAKLGFPSYVSFRYIEMSRVDYGPAEIAEFRRQVKEHVVPIASALRKAQVERLGVERLEYYDEKIQFPDGNPEPTGNEDFILEQASVMYSELSEETDEFFRTMRDLNLLDLTTRDDKATGGYCTSFASEGLPFIFANFNGTTHDVEVLTHEAGHAFQAYRSRVYELLEYRWPTMEACEIHSMAMEYLTWPWMHLFFGDQTEKFRFYHVQSAILFLPYACAVDEFQHWIFENPSVTPDQRNQKWLDLEAVYLPDRDTKALPVAMQGTQWQLQRHIFESPFYYIDYALAQSCALQFWRRSLDNEKQAHSDYLELCDLGGSKSFLALLESVNLSSPFVPGTLAEIVSYAYAWLQSNYEHYLNPLREKAH